MKRKKVFALLALVAAMTASTVAAPAATSFSDVEAGKYYENPIAWAVKENVTSGTSDTTFSPNKVCTRGQIVTLIWNAMGKAEPKSTETKFTDLKSDYYKKAVAWAVEQGITEGTTATTFSPDAECTRAQAVAFLYRAAGSKVKTKAGFTDVAENAYYADAVNWAYRKSITSGTTETKFSPNGKCTRGQIITFIFHAFGGNKSYLSHDKYFDSSKILNNWDEITKEWDTISKDYTKVSIEPGADETKLNFCWQTEKDDKKNKAVVYFGTDKANLKAYEGTVEATDKSLTGDKEYVSNKVTVTDIKPETTYYYQVEKNGVKSDVETYTSKKTDDFKVIYVGDPQIGASTKNEQNGAALTNTVSANTAARNDAAAWARTLDTAYSNNKDASFIISAGDQVNKTGHAKEEEFAGYLSPSTLASLPVATTIGNHDSLTSDYSAHFFTPNATKNGLTKAGGDYYYSYGEALFIVLNTNNYNVAEHQKTIEEAVKSDPDAKWRIVTIHQDIYGSGASHSETDGMILRTQLTPVFDANDIDVVLQGHDHCYSRSKMIYSDGKTTHNGYEFRMNEDKTDYNWNDAYNIKTDKAIPLYPKAEDTQGQSDLEDFQDDNECYTIESAGKDKVTDPKGILYMTANSASGSKYYELNQHRQNFIEEKNQNWLPSYSVIEITKDKFVIDTYQITNDGKTEKIDKTFTIEKTK
ncbi:MAG: S-layer homology domain-containing protein [Lachnospiraceae bacterium]|nr:S-layer homology domain-containing protein [Lachnospiraceae bacterium]